MARPANIELANEAEQVAPGITDADIQKQYMMIQSRLAALQIEERIEAERIKTEKAEEDAIQRQRLNRTIRDEHSRKEAEQAICSHLHPEGIGQFPTRYAGQSFGDRVQSDGTMGKRWTVLVCNMCGKIEEGPYMELRSRLLPKGLWPDDEDVGGVISSPMG